MVPTSPGSLAGSRALFVDTPAEVSLLIDESHTIRARAGRTADEEHQVTKPFTLKRGVLGAGCSHTRLGMSAGKGWLQLKG